MKELTHFSLFSGIGGLDLAAEWAGFKTIGQCEFADYPYSVLCKHWPNVPKWRDVRDVTADDVFKRTGRQVTVLSGGFPCQPHSVAGKRQASSDERDLWPEYRRIIGEIKPRWIVAENVPGLFTTENGRFFGNVLRDISQMGYDATWMCYPASAVGACHKRERAFVVAYAHSVGRLCVDTHQKIRPGSFDRKMFETWWDGQDDIWVDYPWIIPNAGGRQERNDDGISAGLDRLRCLGNAVVPQQAYPIFRAIADVERMIENG